MRTFLVTLGLICSALAAPSELPSDSDGNVNVVHSSDGTYTLDVNLRDYSRKEERFADGTVIGEYQVPDTFGTLQTFKYMSGKDGFRIIEGPLPVAPVDTNVPVVDVNVVGVPDTAEAAFSPQAQETGYVENGVRSIPDTIVVPGSVPAVFLPQPTASIFQQTFDVHQGAPEPVEETPEVKAAKAEHFAAHREALAALGQL